MWGENVEVKSINIVDSPTSKKHMRLLAEIAYDHKFLKPETVWFEVAEDYAGFLTGSGNPWLACLLPLAVTLGEPLRIDRPVDRTLYDNVQELMRIWVGWYPHLQVVSVEADLSESEPDIVRERTGLIPGIRDRTG